MSRINIAVLFALICVLSLVVCGGCGRVSPNGRAEVSGESPESQLLFRGEVVVANRTGSEMAKIQVTGANPDELQIFRGMSLRHGQSLNTTFQGFSVEFPESVLVSWEGSKGDREICETDVPPWNSPDAAVVIVVRGMGDIEISITEDGDWMRLLVN